MNSLHLLTIAGLLAMQKGSNGAFTRTPESASLLPGDVLRLNCGTTLTQPVLWRFTRDGSGNSEDMTNGNLLTEKFRPYFFIDSGSLYDLVARTSNANKSYCGTYECVEAVGTGGGRSATVGLAEQPTCNVDKGMAEATDTVTYTCHATAVCGTINLPLAVQHSGTTVMSGNNSVPWSVTAGSIASSVISCTTTASTILYTAQCPSVIVAVAPRNFQIYPSRSVYQPGDRIQCSAEGNPAPSYHWTDLVSGTVTQGPVLVINDTMLDQEFTFRCTAANDINGETHSTSANISFVVTNEPKTFASTTVVWPTSSVGITSVSTAAAAVSNNAYKSATIALSVIAGIAIVIIVLLVLYIVRRMPSATASKYTGEHRRGPSTEASNPTDDMPSVGYQELNMKPRNDLAVYTELSGHHCENSEQRAAAATTTITSAADAYQELHLRLPNEPIYKQLER